MNEQSGDATIVSKRFGLPVGPIMGAGFVISLGVVALIFYLRQPKPEGGESANPPSGVAATTVVSPEAGEAGSEPSEQSIGATRDYSINRGLMGWTVDDASPASELAWSDYASRVGIVTNLSSGAQLTLENVRVLAFNQDWVLGHGISDYSVPNPDSIVMVAHNRLSGETSTWVADEGPLMAIAERNSNRFWILFGTPSSNFSGSQLDLFDLSTVKLVSSHDLADGVSLWAGPGSAPLVSSMASGIHEVSEDGFSKVGPGSILGTGDGYLISIECDPNLVCYLMRNGERLGVSPPELVARHAQSHRLPVSRDWILYRGQDGQTLRLDLDNGVTQEVDIEPWSEAVTVGDLNFVIGSEGILLIDSDGSGATPVETETNQFDSLVAGENRGG